MNVSTDRNRSVLAHNQALWQWVRRRTAPARAEFLRRWVASHGMVLVLLGTAAVIETFVSAVG